MHVSIKMQRDNGPFACTDRSNLSEQLITMPLIASKKDLEERIGKALANKCTEEQVKDRKRKS